MPCCTVSQGQGQPADCRDSVIDARKRPRAEPNERHSMHARMCRRIPSPGAALVTRSPSPGARYQDLASKRTAASSALDAFLQCAHSHTLSAARAIKLRRCNSQTARRARFSLCNSRILSTSAEGAAMIWELPLMTFIPVSGATRCRAGGCSPADTGQKRTLNASGRRSKAPIPTMIRAAAPHNSPPRCSARLRRW